MAALRRDPGPGYLAWRGWCGISLTEAGRLLDETLNSMEVERLWLAGEYVYWETGIAMAEAPPASEGYEKDTHCSAFAAEGFSSGYAADYPGYPWPENVRYYAHRV